MLLDPSWTFGVDTMSELGISGTNARYLFLIGCLGTGVCAFAYGALMAYSLKPVLLRSVFIILSVAGIFPIGVGLYTAVPIVGNVLLLPLTPLVFVEPTAVILFMVWVLSIDHSFLE